MGLHLLSSPKTSSVCECVLRARVAGTIGQTSSSGQRLSAPVWVKSLEILFTWPRVIVSHTVSRVSSLRSAAREASIGGRTPPCGRHRVPCQGQGGADDRTGGRSGARTSGVTEDTPLPLGIASERSPEHCRCAFLKDPACHLSHAVVHRYVNLQSVRVIRSQ